MTAIQTLGVRYALREQVARLRDSIARRSARLTVDRSADRVDDALAQIDRAGDARMAEQETELLRATERALARLASGTYGVCECCESSISRERLLAVPWASMCRECQEAAEGSAI